MILEAFAGLALIGLAIVLLTAVNTIVVPDVGKTRFGTLVSSLLTGGTPGPISCVVGLYTANSSSGSPPATVVGSFTEPPFTGYARQAMSGTVGAASPPDGVGNDYSSMSSDGTVTFTPTGGWTGSVTVLGYFVYDSTGAVLLYYQPFAAPYTFVSTASSVSFIPPLEFGQL